MNGAVGLPTPVPAVSTTAALLRRAERTHPRANILGDFNCLGLGVLVGSRVVLVLEPPLQTGHESVPNLSRCPAERFRINLFTDGLNLPLKRAPPLLRFV